MKKYFENVIRNKKAQRDKLNAALIECESKEERAAIGETLKALATEIEEAEQQLATIDEPAAEPEQNSDNNDENGTDERGLNPMSTMEMRNGKPAAKAAEQRAKALVDSGKMTIDNNEARAVLVSSGTLATPTEVSGVNDIIGARVSSIVDLVKVTDASGMGAYKVAYQKTDATAATQTEGSEYNASEAAFDYVEIKPQTEAVVSYISKQARKQSPLNYKEKVEGSARVALRKRAAAIATAEILASELNVKLYSVAYDEKFLRKVALSYGGDESVVGAATLFINKTDLVTLGDVRGSDKKPVYEITPDPENPNTGIIKDGGLAVPYCIDSHLPAGTTIYGQGHNCELALFSNYEITVSEDHKITSGLLTIVGDVELGAGVVAQGGFVVSSTSAEA